MCNPAEALGMKAEVPIPIPWEKHAAGNKMPKSSAEIQNILFIAGIFED
jgi:hypothetical protein